MPVGSGDNRERERVMSSEALPAQPCPQCDYPMVAIAGSKQAISCTVSVTPKTTAFTGAIRLQGVKQTAKSAKSKTGKVKLTVRSSKTLKKGQKVVLTLKSGKTTKVITAKTR